MIIPAIAAATMSPDPSILTIDQFNRVMETAQVVCAMDTDEVTREADREGLAPFERVVLYGLCVEYKRGVVDGLVQMKRTLEEHQ